MEKRKNCFVFFARGFSLCRVEDTHFNEIVLLFNGDVNYCAVKKRHMKQAKIIIQM